MEVLMEVFSLFGSAGLTVGQIAGLDTERQSEMRGERLTDVSVSAGETGKAYESTERGKNEEEQRSEGLTPETNHEKEKTEGKSRADIAGNIGEILEISKESEEGMTPETFFQTFGKEIKREELTVADREKDLDPDEGDEAERRDDLERDDEAGKSDQMDKRRQEMDEEERERRLVAGISPHEGRHKTSNRENVEGKREEREDKGENSEKHNESVEREKEDHTVANNLTPPLRTSSTQELEIPPIRIITQSRNPPSSPPPLHHHNVPPSVLPHATVSPQFLPPSVTRPDPTTISVSTATPGDVRSVLLLEDLLAEVFYGPGHHLKQNELEPKANLEDVMVKNILFKPAQRELPTTREISMTQATPKPTRVKLRANDLKTKAPNSTPKSNENNLTAKLDERARKPNITQPASTGNDTKHSTKTRLTTAKTPSVRPTKINRDSKNKTVKKSKDKKRKKDNKTQKKAGKKKAVTTPAYFPYFKDNYCPPDCACYGR